MIMLIVSAETVTKVDIMALKQTIDKSPKALTNFCNVLINAYYKSGNYGLIRSSYSWVI